MIYEVKPKFKGCNAASFPEMMVYLENNALRIPGVYGNAKVVSTVMSKDPDDFTPDPDMKQFTRLLDTRGRDDGGEFAAFSAWTITEGYSVAQIETALREWFDLWGYKDGDAWYEANPVPEPEPAP